MSDRDAVMPLAALMGLDGPNIPRSFGMAVNGRRTGADASIGLHRAHALSRNPPPTSMTGRTAIAQSWHGPTVVDTAARMRPCFSQGPDADLNCPARVALVMLGKIEGIHTLRDTLRDRGYAIKTDNDVELLAHLIDATHQNDPGQAVKRGLGLVKGSIALGVLFRDHPDKLVLAQRGLPLFCKQGDRHFAWSSDKDQLNHGSDGKVFGLADGDVLVVNAQHFNLTSA